MNFLKRSLCLLACLFSTASMGVTFNNIPDGRSELRNLLQLAEKDIAHRCQFDQYLPVRVVTDSQELLSLFARTGLSDVQQYLLTDPEYEVTDGPLRFNHPARLCGLNDWVINSVRGLTTVLNSIASLRTESEPGSNTTNGTENNCTKDDFARAVFQKLQDCEEPSAHSNLSKITLNAVNNDYLVVNGNSSDVEIRHLHLYASNTVSNFSPHSFFQYSGQNLRLENTLLEDYTGHSCKLIAFNTEHSEQQTLSAKLVLKDSQLIFNARSDSGCSSAALSLLQTSAQIDRVKINHRNLSGSFIEFQGQSQLSGQDNYIRNTTFMAPNIATLCGLTFSGGSEQTPLTISNLTFNGGFSTGFHFLSTLPSGAASEYYLSPEGNTGIVWNCDPDSVRCKGHNNFAGTLTFTDGATCVGKLSMPLSSSADTGSTSSAVMPTSVSTTFSTSTPPLISPTIEPLDQTDAGYALSPLILVTAAGLLFTLLGIL